MAEQEEISDPGVESLTDKISDKFHGGDDSSSSSSSESEHEAKVKKTESTSKEKIHRLFGREKSVHKVFGGGKRTYYALMHTHVVILCADCFCSPVVVIFLICAYCSGFGSIFFMFLCVMNFGR